MINKLFTASLLAFIMFTGIGQIDSVQAADSLEDRKKNVEQNLNKVEQSILKTANKVNKMNEDIEVLEAAIASNQEELKKEENNVKKYEQEVKELKNEIKKIEKQIDERNEILKERLSSYQSTGGDLGYLEVIFGSAGFEDFITRFTAVTTITKADNDLIEAQKEAMKKVEATEIKVKEKLAEAESSKNRLAKINELKQSQKAELDSALQSVKNEIQTLKDKKAAYVKEGNDIKALEEKAKAVKEAKIAAAEKAKAEKTAQKSTSTTTTEKNETAEASNQEEVVQESVKNTNSTQAEKTSTNNNSSEKETKTEAKTEKKTVSKPKSEKKSASKPKAEKKSSNNTSKPSSGKAVKELKMQATAYTAKCTGCSGVTATGIDLNKNRNAKVVAVDPSVIPLGSKVWVSGYGTAIAGDTGGAIKGNRIDLHYPTKSGAYSFGRKTVTVKVLK